MLNLIETCVLITWPMFNLMGIFLKFPTLSASQTINIYQRTYTNTGECRLLSANTRSNSYLSVLEMSTYTPADIRKMVDDMDDQIRAAVLKGDAAVVFQRERANLVSNLDKL